MIELKIKKNQIKGEYFHSNKTNKADFRFQESKTKMTIEEIR